MLCLSDTGRFNYKGRKEKAKPVFLINKFPAPPLDMDKCYYNDVGVSSQNVIPDNQMTASSFYKNDDNFQPAYGRLHGTRGGGWCASEKDGSDWLQVDLGKEFELCAIATQGDGAYDKEDEWVTDFKLSYSSDGNVWKKYKDGNGIEVVRLMIVTVIKRKFEIFSVKIECF